MKELKTLTVISSTEASYGVLGAIFAIIADRPLSQLDAFQNGCSAHIG